MIDVDKTTFEEEVLKAEGYVFVDFYGDGCVPCQALMPKVHEFADTYGDKLKFTSLNTTKARRLAIAQKVLGQGVGDAAGKVGHALCLERRVHSANCDHLV